MNSLPKTVNRQRRGCDLNPGRTAHANHSATEPPVQTPVHRPTRICSSLSASHSINQSIYVPRETEELIPDCIYSNSSNSRENFAKISPANFEVIIVLCEQSLTDK